MHELSIAESIVDTVRQYVAHDRLGDVLTVRVKVGAISGVVPDSLEFSYQAITADTPLARSILALELVPFVVRCLECSQEFVNDSGITVCPICSSSNTAIISGRELQMIDIDVDD